MLRRGDATSRRAGTPAQRVRGRCRDTRHVLPLFSKLRVWTRGDERAPHKPLLVLYALGRCARGEPREVAFADVERDVGRPREFGPARKSYHPEYPFWRLRSDDLWVIADASALTPRASNTDPKKSELLRHAVHFKHDAAGIVMLRLPPRPGPVSLGQLARTLVRGLERGDVTGKLRVVHRGRIRECQPPDGS